MMKSFILTFDEVATPREEMVRLVNSLDGVVDWLVFLPAAMIVISPYSAHELSIALNMKRSGMGFVITEIDPTRIDGRLPRQVWDFINNPSSPLRRPLQPALAG